MHHMSATYSPEDNKLRLYTLSRLDKETYNRVRKAGFIWAPKQDLFVAPMWTPSREDLLLELCGEIGDEDISLVDRAEQRADRFTDYSASRAQDADAAHRTVDAIAQRFEGGQPILVGHHSERRARKDAERIETGMRKAIQMWETSKYWTARAAGAIHNAKYKQRPDVRARRIKTIEAEIRSYRARFTPADNPPQVIMQSRWDAPADAPTEPHTWCAPRGGRGGSWVPVASLPTLETYYSRWITHCENRLAYERAMLEADGGTETDKKGPEKGGACKCWASPRGGWSYIHKVNKVSVTVFDNWGNGGENFTRTMPFDKLSAIMTKAEVEEKRAAGLLMEDANKTGFYLLDTSPPAPRPAPAAEEGQKFDALREQLKAGVHVVSAPQLFPTPPELADRMVQLADIRPGQDVLEPSAGTGAIIDAIRRKPNHGCAITAVEINPHLAARLRDIDCLGESHVRCVDFLSCNGDLGQFDRILMNPPFANAEDIEHIQHALTMLKPGGRLVAICANGPRQNDVLKPLVQEHGGQWEVLPAGTFKESGSNVASVLLSMLR